VKHFCNARDAIPYI
jgi:hypothetical protein